MNKFDQLVSDLSDGSLTPTMIQIALRTWVRQNPKVPDGVKGILCGESDGAIGLIGQIFSVIQSVIGKTELAYRRGSQEPVKDD